MLRVSESMGFASVAEDRLSTPTRERVQRPRWPEVPRRAGPLTAFLTSPEGASDSSPRRKPWVRRR